LVVLYDAAQPDSILPFEKLTEETFAGLTAREKARIELMPYERGRLSADRVNEITGALEKQYATAVNLSNRAKLGIGGGKLLAEKQFEFNAAGYGKYPWLVKTAYTVMLKIAEVDARDVAALVRQIGDGAVTYKIDGNRYQFALNLQALVSQIVEVERARKEFEKAA